MELAGIRAEQVHASATAGALLYAEMNFTMIRVGIGAYGIWPSRESQIAAREWSWEFHGETNIVDVYIGYLRRKLDEGGAPSVVETLRGYGYRLKDEARGG